MQRRKAATIAAAMGVIVVCAASAVSAGTATHAKHRIHTLMINSGAQPSARGKINLVQSKAQSTFTISVQGLDAGVTYDVVVDGAVRDQIPIGASGRGKVAHRSRSRVSAARALPYDPRGSTVQIASPGGVVLSAEVPETEEECDALIEIP